LGVAAGLAFTQIMHDWPIPMRKRRTSSNGHGKRRGGRRAAVH
jgi:hypothetical protein